MQVTESTINEQARVAKYFDEQSERWKGLSTFERIVRIVLGLLLPCLVDTPEKYCLSRSWESVAKMSVIPGEIARKIATLLQETKYNSNPISRFVGEIARIYIRVMGKDARLANMTIVQAKKSKKRFVVSKEGANWKVIKSTKFASLEFSEGGRITHTNFHDSLRDCDDSFVAGIKMACNYPNLDTTLRIFPLDALPIDVLVNKTTILFERNRELLAIALKSDKKRIEWDLTIMVQDMGDKDQLLLAWGVMKWSQHAHFDFSSREHPFE